MAKGKMPKKGKNLLETKGKAKGGFKFGQNAKEQPMGGKKTKKGTMGF